MQVKNIIQLVATYLQLNELTNDVLLNGENETNEETLNEINLLVSCVNLCNNIIATDYLPLKYTMQVFSSDGIIPISKLEANTRSIYEIINVKNNFNEAQVFKIISSTIRTVKGNVLITFSYFPNEVNLNGKINDYSHKLTERVFAYGVACEYCFIKGLYDEATVWDSRFKEGLKSICRPKHNVVVPAHSRWL